MSYYMYPAEKLKRAYPVTFRDDDGNVLTSVSVLVAVLPQRTVPVLATTGVEADYTAYGSPDENGFYGEIDLLVAGPEADTTGNALPLYEWGGDLYVKPDENPEVDWQFMERFAILR